MQQIKSYKVVNGRLFTIFHTRSEYIKISITHFNKKCSLTVTITDGNIGSEKNQFSLRFTSRHQIIQLLDSMVSRLQQFKQEDWEILLNDFISAPDSSIGMFMIDLKNRNYPKAWKVFSMIENIPLLELIDQTPYLNYLPLEASGYRKLFLLHFSQKRLTSS